MLFSGFMIPVNRIPAFFKPIYDASFFQYGLSLVLINEYSDKTFTDCKFPRALNEASSCEYPGGIANLTVQCPEFASALQGGNQHCFPTGRTYLASLELEASDTGPYFGILIGFAVATAFLAFVSFTSKIT